MAQTDCSIPYHHSGILARGKREEVDGHPLPFQGHSLEAELTTFAPVSLVRTWPSLTIREPGKYGLSLGNYILNETCGLWILLLKEA